MRTMQGCELSLYRPASTESNSLFGCGHLAIIVVLANTGHFCLIWIDEDEGDA